MPPFFIGGLNVVKLIWQYLRFCYSLYTEIIGFFLCMRWRLSTVDNVIFECGTTAKPFLPQVAQWFLKRNTRRAQLGPGCYLSLLFGVWV